MRILLAAAAIAKALDVQDVAFAVITASPVQKQRLPPLLDAWITAARRRHITIIVISDACDDINCIAVACQASQAGVPFKSGRAFVELLKAAPDAKWYARVMDDTFVDVEALAWHLAPYDATELYYAGDMATAYDSSGVEKFKFAWGGAGWALSRAAAAEAAAHLEFYDFLAETTGCPNGMCHTNISWPSTYNGAPRGLRLNNAHADDVIFGMYMRALNVEAVGPAGFQQTPLDILGGAPVCSSVDAAAARRRPADPDYEACVSGAPGRVHALGAFFDEDLQETASALATSSCRGAQRPAAIHLGEETGGPLNALWRAQLPRLVDAFRGRSLASVPRGSPYHYGRLCVLEGEPVPPTELETLPAPLPLPFESHGVPHSVGVGPCDSPDGVARTACGVLERDDEACVEQLRAMAMRLRDALWGHRRPVSAEVVLGDGSTVTVEVPAGEDAGGVAAAACGAHGIVQHDCDALRDWLVSRGPPVVCDV